jgi:hypothetical protein
MKRTQFRAKSAKDDLKPMDFPNRNFYFETEGVISYCFMVPTLLILKYHNNNMGHQKNSIDVAKNLISHLWIQGKPKL